MVFRNTTCFLAASRASVRWRVICSAIVLVLSNPLLLQVMTFPLANDPRYMEAHHRRLNLGCV